MIDLSKIKNVYFLGIGGIGMSAIARFFSAHGYNVEGYDRTASEITNELQHSGINVHFNDDPGKIKDHFLDEQSSLIVYTPAIPDENSEKQYFLRKGIKVVKRAELLGLLSKDFKTLAVAGTHGKTTISSMIAHFMQFLPDRAHAFVGGITSNYNSNYIDAGKSNFMVVEADEFDRSFLHLTPESAVITKMDADHLDIYKNTTALEKAFEIFAGQVSNKLIINLEIKDKIRNYSFTYSLNKKEADFFASEIKKEGLYYRFNFNTPDTQIKDILTNVPGILNLENTVAALSIAYLKGLDKHKIRKAVNSFKGIKRRFELIKKNNDIVYIDDYAHHPVELTKTINSVKDLFPEKKITGIFQPHLYSRTKDFSTDFAKALDFLDECILLPVYPAREKPVKGVESDIILSQMKISNKRLLKKNELITYLKNSDHQVLITLGAGDIDRLVPQIEKLFE